MIGGATSLIGQGTVATAELENKDATSAPLAAKPPPPPPPLPREKPSGKLQMSSLQSLLLQRAKDLQPSAKAARGSAPEGLAADSKPSAKPVEKVKKTWVISADPAIHKHQGGEYKMLTSFALTLKDQNIAHYSNSIEDKAGFVAAWKQKASSTLRMNTEQVESIDEEKLAQVVGTLSSIDKEWAGYKASTETETFRGDGISIGESFPWLQKIIDGPKGPEVSKIAIGATETAPTIMSTSAEKDCNYAKNATILWKFSLPEGKHQGISEPIYASEGEVTFPMYNRMHVKSVTVIPEGQSFDSEANGAGFGTAHRYVIEAEMLPRARDVGGAVGGL